MPAPQESTARTVPFSKGHGTENDFVLIEDRDGRWDLSAAQVRGLCDRHAGIGADGVLRVVPGRLAADWDGDPEVWFMDYRNADGSVAEMCGNGVRVFVRYLIDRGLADGPEVAVGTRDGLKQTLVLPDGRIRVAMGRAEVLGRDVEVRPASGERAWPAYRVDIGNPHAVAVLGPRDGVQLAELDLSRPPDWTPADRFPDGVNVEFVRSVGERRLSMRVYERGSGETRSCGTGTCAAVAAAATEFADEQRPARYRVDVRGGSVEVELTSEETYLTGPAVLVACGEVRIGNAEAEEANGIVDEARKEV